MYLKKKAMPKPKIIFGTDHAGFKLKEALKIFVESLGHETEDLGTHSSKACDYPDFIFPVAKKVARDHTLKGIILGGSGEGEAMTANRIKGARATAYYGGSNDIILLSKKHNNANILSLGARFIDEKEAKKAVKLWLSTSFSNEERHKRRIAKLDK
jgi:ribose 5-phosphate isomerase B